MIFEFPENKIKIKTDLRFPESKYKELKRLVDERGALFNETIVYLTCLALDEYLKSMQKPQNLSKPKVDNQEKEKSINDIDVPKKTEKVELIDEEIKAQKRAYFRNFYAKNREKILAQQKINREKRLNIGLQKPLEKPEIEEIESMPCQVEEAEKPYGFMDKKIKEARKREAEHLKSMILVCECYLHEKIIQGFEKKYKGHIFFADRCIDWYKSEIEEKENKYRVSDINKPDLELNT